MVIDFNKGMQKIRSTSLAWIMHKLSITSTHITLSKRVRHIFES